MIEELCEFLVKHGFDEATAADIHDDYRYDGLSGVAPAVLRFVERWRREVGEE